MLDSRWTVLDRVEDEPDAVTRERRAFLSALSHDLRQPVQALALVSSAMQPQGPSPEPGDFPRMIQSVAGELTTRLDAMQKFLHLHEADTPAHLAPIALSDVVADVARDWGPEVARAGGRLLTHVRQDQVRSNRKELVSLIGTLVDNAMKFSKPGPVLVSARRRGGRVWFEVWDQGAGIPDDAGPAVFRPWVQFSPSRSRPPGLGLGLALAGRLAARLGCRLAYRSQPGRGTRFAVILPEGKGIEAP